MFVKDPEQIAWFVQSLEEGDRRARVQYEAEERKRQAAEKAAKSAKDQQSLK
jgi:hypothetical protein